MARRNLFNGTGYFSQLSERVYKSLMTRQWVKYAEIKEREKKEGYKGTANALKKAFPAVCDAIREVAGAESIEKEGDLKHRRIRYVGEDPDPLGDMLRARTIKSLKKYWRFCQDSAGFFPMSWLEYFFGDRKQALADAKAGTTLEGTERMKDVARIIYMYVKADVEPINSNFDNWLAGELNWLNQHLANYYYNRSRARLLNCVVGEKYAKANQPYMSAALYAMDNSECAFTLVDTMKVEDLPQYLRYIETPAQTPLEKVVKAKLKIEEERLNDLIGTKYLRVRCWEDAIFWLNKVPLSYYNQKGYAVYAANRRYTVEPWMKRQWLKSNLEWDHDEIHLKSNPKLDFVMEMYRMEGELDLLSGKEYYQRCYDLAVRYAQAHFTGDCWFLTHDGKSVYDVQKPNETDLAAKALAYLQKATQTKDMKLKEKALFAMTYCIFYPKTWYTMEWNDGKRDYEQMEHQDSPQYAALTNLLRFERANANNVSNYVTLCDEYQTFAKSH